jgi:hypothetical protein
MSHLGRPDGKAKPEFSLKPVAEKLQELIKRPVKFLNDCVGPEVEKACAAMKPGDVILLENSKYRLDFELACCRQAVRTFQRHVIVAAIHNLNFGRAEFFHLSLDLNEVLCVRGMNCDNRLHFSLHSVGFIALPMK